MSEHCMRILVTNDDGIHARPGLRVAEKHRPRARPTMSGWSRRRPNNPAASHSLTLTTPLRLRKIDERRFAVTGTPTDCVMMARRI